MGKRILWILVAALALITGCKGADEPKEESSFSGRYRESAEVFRYEQEYCPFYLAGAGDFCFYFYQRTDWEEEGYAHWTTDFYRQACSGNSEPERMNLSFENPFHTACFVVPGEGGEDLLCLLMMEETDEGRKYRIAVYTGEGELREEISLRDAALSDMAVCGLLPLGESGFGVLAREKLFVVDKSGDTKAVFACPQGAFQGMARISDDEIAVTYYDAEERAVWLSVANWKKRQMTEGRKIKGDGQLLFCEAGKICFMDTQAIYEMDLDEKEIRVKISLEGRNIFGGRIADVKAWDGKTALLCYGADPNVVKYMVFTAEEEQGGERSGDEQGGEGNAGKEQGGEGDAGEGTSLSNMADCDQYGRRLLYIYDYASGPGEKNDLKTIIDAFNEQSDSYQVALRDYGFKNTYDDGFDPLQIIASKEFPDLIFSTPNALVRVLNEKDCLTDLTPFLEKSENISPSDLVVPVVNACSDQGKIYALPRTFQMTSIAGRKSQMGEPGWTVDEFLSWIEAHPDLESRMNLTKDAVYDMCVDAAIASCLEPEGREADFTSGDFSSFIVRIRDLNRSNELQKPDFEPAVAPDSWYIEEAGIGNLNRGAYAELEYGEECVFKGYPGKDGEPVFYLDLTALSIFRTSDAQEGAYEFLEYYLLYQDEVLSGRMQNMGSPLYTLKGYLEKGVELTLKQEELFGEPCAVTGEQVRKVLEMFPYAVLRQEKYGEIRTIVDEEIKPFLAGQKEAEDVCEIIQSRVRVYLRENG